jgi:hypothetical protein
LFQFLLKLVNSIRARDAITAEEAIRDYFDWSSVRMRFTDTTIATNANISIFEADRRPLRYAPLLNAKLARAFGLR